jgi:hypothetical protein
MLEKLAFALLCEPADLIMRDPNSDSWTILDEVRGLPDADVHRIAAIIQAMRRTGS